MVRSHPIYAALYDRLNNYAEVDWLGRARQWVADRSKGTVLEIGAGTGMNMVRFTDVDEYIACEPDPAYRRRLLRRVPESRVPVRVIDCPAEQLSLPDHSVDTVISTLTLCSVEDPARAVSEIARVLRPGGELLLFEHIRNGRLLQRLCTPAFRLFVGGCRITRPTLDTVRAKGFQVEVIDSLELSGATSVMAPFVTAVAHLPGDPA
ncbi:type 11 methyltransferase [Lentzea sp. NBRC 105346]|uniref:class I SAM-dependent methyltransferase n=1 Tax=Lentzea sp. NBRC 105346 TaxID=3032205 RepID=UPI00249FDF9F|nr:class I SAM-dependent methyltransferase [Lentzea sp. NBRC 105346]GLZ30955.1 type 11 methyltransferase [Lentzea sp. NBRC 105346]